MSQSIDAFIEAVGKRNPNEPEFMQAVKEVAETVIPFIEKNKKYEGKMLLERMVEAERIIIFRVVWLDDAGNTQVNRGYRIQMNSAIGPYKGGIRFHPSVNLSILKFLAFAPIPTSYDKSFFFAFIDRKSTRLNSSHSTLSRMPSSA